jgi:hypothetical protein
LAKEAEATLDPVTGNRLLGERLYKLATELERERLQAVRQATTAIHPALKCFCEALDRGHKVRFAATR